MHNYRVVQKLADGSAADVFLARAKSSSEEVIVEVLRRDLQDDTLIVNRFLAEAKLRQSLTHPNVTRRVGEGRTPDGRPFFVTEPVTGESLRTCLIKHGPIGLRELLKLMVPICDALHYLHQRGMIHGNLKPANVYLCGGLAAYNPKLFDSGLALFRTGRALPTKSMMLVEPEYMAPERIGGQRANILSDVYALGLLLYEMASGGPPFTSREIRETRRRQVQDPCPPLPPGYEPLAPILARCLAKEPRQRYPNAAELRDELLALSRQNLSATGGRDGKVNLGASEGEVLGNYQLQKLLGAGAMGQVFQARHVRLDRAMAIKLLRPEHASNRGFIDRFFQEARAANQINHEHIVQIFDFVEEQSADGPRVYCVMELLHGKSLEQLIRQESVGVQRTVRMARQICSALAASHKVGVVHRDIKPDNIFITERGGVREYVKVLDFGVAKLRPANGAKDSADGEIVGTPAYMAPEQAAGGTTDSRTDIYALGTVLYRMLAGKLPFRAPSLARHIAKLISEPPPPMGDVTPGGEAVPPELKRLVMRCLEKDPARRPQSMTVLAELLKPFEEGPVRRLDGGDEPYQMAHIEAALEQMWSAEASGPQLIAQDEVQLLESMAARPAARTPTPPPPRIAPVSSPRHTPVPPARRPLGEDEPQKTRAERPLMKSLHGADGDEGGPSALTALAEHSLLSDEVAGLKEFDEPLRGQELSVSPSRPDEPLSFEQPEEPDEPLELVTRARPRTPPPLATQPLSPRPQRAPAKGMGASVYWGGAVALCLALATLTWRLIPTARPPVSDELSPTAPIRVEPAGKPITTRRVKLQLNSDPPGARVVRVQTGRLIGVTPLEYEGIASDQPLSLTFELAGHLPTPREVPMDADARITVQLERAPEPEAAQPRRLFKKRR